MIVTWKTIPRERVGKEPSWRIAVEMEAWERECAEGRWTYAMDGVVTYKQAPDCGLVFQFAVPLVLPIRGGGALR
jgi:hypothetical protein